MAPSSGPRRRLLPVAIGSLIAVHLAMVATPHHTQFRGRGRNERNIVGTPLWPAYALRSLGLFAAAAAVLFALGGRVQINPIWQWGTALGLPGGQVSPRPILGRKAACTSSR